MRGRCAESGNMTLEAALFVPLALAFCAIVAQVAWTLFQTACFDQALAQSPMRLERQGIRTGGADEIKEAVVSHWTPIDESALTIEDASIEEHSALRSNATNGPKDREVYLIEQTSTSVRSLRVKAKAYYAIEPIIPLPGFRPVTVERILDRSVLSTSRFEAS